MREIWAQSLGWGDLLETERPCPSFLPERVSKSALSASVDAVTQSSRWCFEPPEVSGRRNLLRPSYQIQTVLLALPGQASWDPNTQDEVHLDITCQ